MTRTRSLPYLALPTALVTLLLIAGACSDKPAKKGDASGAADAAGSVDVTGAGDAAGGVDSASAADVAADSGEADAGAPQDTSGGCSTPADCKGEPGECRQWLCSAGQCVPGALPDGAICGDDGKCKPGVCDKGTCVGAVKDCACGTDADCDKEEDGDLCNGTLYCDKASGTCKVNAATVVSCPTSKDTACTKNTCDPKTGACAMADLPEKTACDDGDTCTQGDICDGQGGCAGKGTCACTKDADCAAKDDGDKCNGLPFCNLATGECVVNPATVVVCPTVDDTACAKNTCDPKTGACGMTSSKDGAPCDDANPCTNDETCTKGSCASKTNLCACATDADCTAKDDGDLCNGTLFCNQQLKTCQPNPATVVSCQSVDNTPCVENTCQPKTGACKPTPKKDGAPCDDGSACTVGDACAKGVCTPAAKAPQCACQQDTDCAKFEDGNLCNGTLVCDKAAKQCILNPATVVVCKTVDDTQCSQNLCDPKSGKCALTPVNLNATCDDSQPCTTSDRCDTKGQCVGNDVCECGPHKPSVDCEATKGDGDLCNGVMWCDTAKVPFTCKAKPKSEVTCPTVDDTFCQKNVCDPKKGLCALAPVAANVGKPCDDANPCTTGTTCSAGMCVGGTTKACDDGNACTQDACAKGSGCVHTKLTGAPCSDGKACTVGEACANGVCSGAKAKSCDDGNSCTADACDSKTGKCTQSPAGGSCVVGGVVSACSKGACAVPTCPAFVGLSPAEGSTESVVKSVVAMGAGGGASVGMDRTGSGDWVPRATRRAAGGAVKWVWREATGHKSPAYATAAIDATDGGAFDDGLAELVVVGSEAKGVTVQGALWRLDAKGKQLTRDTYGGSGEERFNDAVLHDRTLYAAGASSTGSNGKLDSWLVAIDSHTRKLVWQGTWGGAKDEHCAGVAASGTRVVCVGATESEGLNTDGWVVVTDTEGKLQWKKNYGIGGGIQRFFAVDLADSGEMLAVGRSQDGNALGWLVALSQSGGITDSAFPKQLRSAFDIHREGDGLWSVLGSAPPYVAGSQSDNGLYASVVARVDSKLKVTWSTSGPASQAASHTGGFASTGGGYVVGGASHHAGTKLLQGQVAVIDAWGQSDCAKSGQCLNPSLRLCDDGDPCTTDSCVAATGCAHAAIGGCKVAKEAQDLDHDGKLGAGDPCATVWTPTGKACADVPASLKQTHQLRLGASGSAPGASAQRRTHEPVELALVNGVVDPSLVAWWKLDGDFSDATGNAGSLSKAKGVSARGAFGGTTGGMRMRGVADNSSTQIGPLIVEDVTVMVWARCLRDAKGDDCTLVSATGKVSGLTYQGHVSFKLDDDGAVRLSYGQHTGGYEGPLVARIRSDDHLVDTPNQWHHYAFVSRAGVPVAIFVDGVGVRSRADGNEPITAGHPVPIEWLRLGEDDPSDATVHLDDVLIFDRGLSAEEIAAYAHSRRPFASTLAAKARPDWGDVRVSEQAPWEAKPHLVPSEVVGRRPFSSEAKVSGTVMLYRLDGDLKNAGGVTTTAKGTSVTYGAGAFGSGGKAAVFNGKTSLVEISGAATTLEDFTAELWFRLDKTSHKRVYLLDTRNSKGAFKPGLALLFDQNTANGTWTLKHGVSTPTGKDHFATVGGLRLGHGWHHTALVREQGELSVWLDGAQLSTSFSNGDTVNAKLPILGTKKTRLGLYGGSDAGVQQTNYALAGALDDVIIHPKALSRAALQGRGHGLPAVRFLASTSAGKAYDGHRFYRYRLHWGDAKLGAQPPELLSADGKKSCSRLLSPCLGYAGWWRFGGAGAVAMDTSATHAPGAVEGGVQRAGAVVISAVKDKVSLGNVEAPFYGAFTLEWTGRTEVALLENAQLLHCEGEPALGLKSGKWAMAVTPISGVATGAKPAINQVMSAAGSYAPGAKKATLFVDGALVSEAQANEPPKPAKINPICSVAGGSQGAGFEQRAMDVRIMSRALSADELLKWPRATVSVAP